MLNEYQNLLMPEVTGSSADLTSDKKILVTGASGLLGSELVKQLLEKNYHVTAIFHSTTPTTVHRNLIARQCDILDTGGLEEIMKGITHVYHCAAFISYQPKDKYRLLKIN